MKLKLTMPARVRLEAGTVVDTDPAQANYLLSVHVAVPYEEEAPVKTEKPKKKASK